MRQAEALAVCKLLSEALILLKQVEEGIQISGISILILPADVTGVLPLGNPGSNGVVLSRLFESAFKGGPAGLKACKLLFHFLKGFLIMCFENPGISKSIAVVKHFLEMSPAEAGNICLFPDIGFHIGGAGTKHKVHQILLQASFKEAEGTFVMGIYRII